MLLSAATTEDKEKTEPVIWVLVRSRPYFVRVRQYLVWCYAQNPADRPAVVLLEYMAAKRFAAPKGWLGCRRDDYEDDAEALRV